MEKRLALFFSVAVAAALYLVGCQAQDLPPLLVTPTSPAVEAPAAPAPALDREEQAVAPSPLPTATPTSTPEAAEVLVAPAMPPRRPTEPLVPTVPPAPAATVEPAAEVAAPAAPSPASQPVATLSPDEARRRLGVGWAGAVPQDPLVAQRLGFGWYLDWTVQPHPLAVEGLEFAQMVLTRDSTPFWGQRDRIAAAVKAHPGALWLIGNEPDVPWQDNVTPEVYARRYHQFYIYIKSLDPTARVAIGGVSQPTPLRMAYLDRVLEAYQALFNRPMPVDVWNVHAFILREERDSWGVGIPPGFEHVNQGILFEIADHDNLAIFRQQIVDFRRWMAGRGLQDKPLLVTEYGILMPEEYGFPPEAVIRFMRASFDFLLEGRDPEVGMPADDYRLVQGLAWFSVGDDLYPTGNLVDPATGRLTAVGQAFVEYVAALYR
ncbi:MAG: glycosyl hydrolase [Caldilineales bacterium]|nr:glycosyl hydrolase [Caldilineales bacterium]MDW8316217.1 glycosyl hydrolase [Anaerolineae bacterium]